ncbi:Protein tyrosine phosphatase [hydrothermal vent metagenome]|uniref:Protein tyrosine phosphatase n=1 Tax=hydrothermal vent metagenome TaxID=652676 RepID=A0A3B0RZ40_9ZZZZ
MGLLKRITDWERRVRASYNTDLSTPENRRRARIYNLWFDHAVLRSFWTNMHVVAPGVYRSNQPTHARFIKLKAMGIRSIVNLRGDGGAAHYLVEEESCQQLGLSLINVAMQARLAPARADIDALIRAFRAAEKPFVMHCKSGADRAGFASVIYLLVIEGRPLAEARKMLGLRFLHLKWSRAGILDFILDQYEAHHTDTGISFKDWIATDYDSKTLQAEYMARQKSGF